jgi:hypothetical protein
MFDYKGFAEVLQPDVLTAIIRSVRDRTMMIQALIRFESALSSERIMEVIQAAGNPYSDIAASGKRPLLPKGTMNQELAEVLKTRDLISSFSDDSDGVRINTFHGDE